MTGVSGHPVNGFVFGPVLLRTGVYKSFVQGHRTDMDLSRLSLIDSIKSNRFEKPRNVARQMNSRDQAIRASAALDRRSWIRVCLQLTLCKTLINWVINTINVDPP